MLKIFQKNSKNTLIIVPFLCFANAYAVGDRISDGNVNIKIQGDNICFSPSDYKPRSSFFKKYKVDDSDLKFVSISVGSLRSGSVWEMQIPYEQYSKALPLKSNTCIKYGESLSDYTIRKEKGDLSQGSYKVFLRGYDNNKNTTIVFFSVFGLGFLDRKLKINSVD